MFQDMTDLEKNRYRALVAKDKANKKSQLDKEESYGRSSKKNITKTPAPAPVYVPTPTLQRFLKATAITKRIWQEVKVEQQLS